MRAGSGKTKGGAWEGSDRRRQASCERVMGVLRELGPSSRAEIMERTGLSRATVSSVVAELQAAGLVRDDERADGTRSGQGRTPGLVRLDAAAGAALGIDFGKQHLRVAVADLGHQILAERKVEMARDHRAEEGIDTAVALVDEVLAEAEVSRDAIVGAGMGLPGPVDEATGELGSTTILPGWRGVHGAAAMAERLDLPVRVDNDANLGALSEWTWGAASGERDVAYLKISTGIGAGLILGGRPFRGTDGIAGEIGHTIVDANGPVCRCGNRGCLETYVGAPALLEVLRPAHGELTVRELLARCEAGDSGCRRVIADAGRTIGAALGTLCNLVNPGCVVVGGDLAAAGDILLDALRDGLQRSAIPRAAAPRVVAGVLGERAEVLGAVALVLRESGRGFTASVTARAASPA